MIYFFSGTGNSKEIAKQLCSALNDEMTPITWDTEAKIPENPTERIGLVFPVYGWGLPRVVERFISKIPFHTTVHKRYVYAVLTCGDDIGKTDVLLRQSLQAKGWNLSAVFSIQMRNTYICLPGFDVDSEATVKEKQIKSAKQLNNITNKIMHCEPSLPSDVHPGTMAWFKSYVLRPLFNRFLISPKHFHVNGKTCTQCGRCIRICPLHNIEKDENGFPAWKEQCTHCLACYHGCPQHAIEFGFFTKSKGQVKINF